MTLYVQRRLDKKVYKVLQVRPSKIYVAEDMITEAPYSFHEEEVTEVQSPTIEETWLLIPRLVSTLADGTMTEENIIGKAHQLLREAGVDITLPVMKAIREYVRKNI